MPLIVEAVYENGVLKPTQPLPLEEHEKVQLSIRSSAEIPESLPAVQRGYGLIRWTGPLEELDSLIEDEENDPLEGP